MKLMFSVFDNFVFRDSRLCLYAARISHRKIFSHINNTGLGFLCVKNLCPFHQKFTKESILLEIRKRDEKGFRQLFVVALGALYLHTMKNDTMQSRIKQRKIELHREFLIGVVSAQYMSRLK